MGETLWARWALGCWMRRRGVPPTRIGRLILYEAAVGAVQLLFVFLIVLRERMLMVDDIIQMDFELSDPLPEKNLF